MKTNRHKLYIGFGVFLLLLMFCSLPSEATTQGWNKDSQGWYYIKNDGTRYKYGIYTINGVKYGFDVEGYMFTNRFWLYNNGDPHSYMATSSGAVVTTPGFYRGSDGLLYYITDGGYLAENQFISTPEGYMYFEGGFCSLVVNSGFWAGNPFKCYLADENGYMVSRDEGWYQSKDGRWYYFYEKNHVVADKIYVIDGKEYVFDSDGTLVINNSVSIQDDSIGDRVYHLTDENGCLIHHEKGWYEAANGKIYYYKDTDTLGRDEIIEIGGVKYFIDSNGSLGRYVIRSYWHNEDGRYAYFISDGNGIVAVEDAIGWVTVDDRTYYFGAGREFVPRYCRIEIDGEYYCFDQESKLGHPMSEWKITKEASYSATGEKSRKCDFCDYTETEIIEKYIATDMKLEKSAIKLLNYHSVVLKTICAPVTAKENDIIWTSSNADIVSVDNMGIIKAHNLGTAIITATLGEFTSTCEVTVLPGEWRKDSTGWWYYNADGTYPKNCWKEIDGINYYFNSNGYMATNRWVGDYYVGADGTIQKNKWIGVYYVGADGKYLKNTWIEDKYYLGSNGAYVKNAWLEFPEGWYYFSLSGIKVTNAWVESYWLGSDGVMATNAWVDNGKSYVNASGIYQTGWLLLDGNWYYLGTNGVLQKGWIKVGGTWYYGDKADGRIYEQEWLDDTYYFKDGGAMVTGWYLLNGDYYYYAGSGAKITNQWIGNYYLKADGKMAVSEWIGNYYVGADGAWIPGYKR